MQIEHVALLLSAPFIGSFLGVLIDRLPNGQRVVFDRSHCSDCLHVLNPRDLIPLLSGVLSGGRCRYCGSRIGARYPAIELAALGIAVWSVIVLPGWLALAGCGLGWVLLTLAVIDFRSFLLPDQLTLPLIAAGVLVAWLNHPATLSDHVAGAVIGLIGFLAVGLLYRRMRSREGLGMGDAKLLAAAGSWVAWQGLPSVVLYGAVSGLALVLGRSLMGHRLSAAEPIPFGPHLCLGAWLVWLYGPVVPA